MFCVLSSLMRKRASLDFFLLVRFRVFLFGWLWLDCRATCLQQEKDKKESCRQSMKMFSTCCLDNATCFVRWAVFTLSTGFSHHGAGQPSHRAVIWVAGQALLVVIIISCRLKLKLYAGCACEVAMRPSPGIGHLISFQIAPRPLTAPCYINNRFSHETQTNNLCCRILQDSLESFCPALMNIWRGLLAAAERFVFLFRLH